MAIENSRLYERERERSRMLQLSLIGGVPLGHPVVSAATRYVAGSSDLEVGGDWFDLVERDDGRIAVIVGDVVGRGLHAATAMGKLRSAIGALSLVSGSPAEILERLDRFAAGIVEAELATVVCGLLNPEDGTLVYSSAGHLPGIVVGAGGETTFLEDGRGFPLGVDVTSPRVDGQTTLETGATLLFFTDGLVEAPGLPIEDGLERLGAAAGAGAEQHPELLCDELLDTLVTRLRDDIALVCVRFSPVPAEYQVWRYPAEADRLAPARHAFGTWLEERGVPEESRADLVLAFSEACSNAVRHAYVDGEGTISVHLRYDDGLLTINVSDTGRWTEPDPRSDGGRGLEMIRLLLDDVHVHGTPYGTTVVMAKNIELAPLGVPVAAGFSGISSG
jgi:anti-sigma regulatory factor (Ser/Thr protein kinase)